MKGVVWAGVCKMMPDKREDNELGKSGRSTSMVIEAEWASCPATVVPSAVRRYWPGAMSDGMAMENWVGTEAATVLIPIGLSPITSTWANVAPAGELTATDRFCPGLTMAPFAGDVI
jgi:hypothetical protein